MSDFLPIIVLQIKICIKPDRRGKGSKKYLKKYSFRRNISREGAFSTFCGSGNQKRFWDFGAHRSLIKARDCEFFDLSPFSLIQNRTNDFGVSFLYLRRSALPVSNTTFTYGKCRFAWPHHYNYRGLTPGNGINPYVFIVHSRKFSGQ